MDAVMEWLATLRWGELGILAGLVLALVLAVVRWWQARREVREHARSEGELRQRVALMESTRDGIALLGRGDRFVYANPAAARLLGYRSPRDLFGKAWAGFLPPEEAHRFEKDVFPRVRRRGGWVGEVEVRERDGRSVVLELSLSAVRDDLVAWVARDAGWREGRRHEIRQEVEQYRRMVETAGSAIVLLAPDRRILEWNREAERLFDRERAAVVDRDFAEVVARNGESGHVLEAVEAAASEDGARTFETRVGEGEGERLLLWRVSRLERGTEEAPRVLAIGQDITEHRRAQAALERQEGLYRLLAHNSTDLVALHDPEGCFLYVSPSCGSLLGFEKEEMLGKDPYQLAHSDDWKRIQSAIVAAQGGRMHRSAVRFRSRTGEYRWFEMVMRPIRDGDGEVVQLQSSSRDISERKAFEEQLEHQALHEPLTGLPNRNLFMDRLKQALARARRGGTRVGVMFMDLDRFKVVNDSMGHAAGDRLLAAVARRLRSCLREADTVARLGGDEFGVLLEFDIEQRDAGSVADRILHHLKPPFAVSGQEIFVTASIGIAFSDESIQRPEDLLRYADVAMFRAKDEGPGTWRVFDPAVDAQATRRLEMETALRKALEREELFVLYQPLVSLERGHIVGMEALVRWRHPERGMVGPAEFISIAEDSGLIVPLGYWVARQACREGRRWRDAAAEDRPLVVSVNLSTRQFEHATLTEDIAAILDETGLPPHALQLEITESEVIQSAGRIAELKKLGVRVAIDDFGTGYSSLSYLKHLDVDALKVDKSFVHGLGRNREDAAIVRTVITLAEALGLEVTAEGIETDEQLRLLRELGCPAGQGYLFARPRTADEATDLLAQDPTW